jgi:hypothetical protein
VNRPAPLSRPGRMANDYEGVERMTSIPKSPMRGNGRDPRPATGGFPPRPSHHREPYRPVQEPPPPGSSPWEAVDHIQALRDVLDAYFGSNDYAFDAWGYSTELDLAYQSTITGLVRFLDHVPCFEGMRQRAPIFEALPPALGALARDDRHAWREHWRGEAIALQSEMVAALVAAGIPRLAAGEPQPTKLMVELDGEPAPEPDTENAIGVPFALSAGSGDLSLASPTRSTEATRNALLGAKKARAFRKQGRTRQDIANELGVAVSTVDNYLNDEYWNNLVRRYRTGSNAQ